jgi:hypothetical protein
MNPVSALQAWNAAFPQSAPAAFLCRPATADRWLRTHSLPDSKRYAEGDDEREEILRRYNAIATEVLGADAQCLVFVARFGHGRDWRPDEDSPLNRMNPTHVLSHGTEDDEIQFFAAAATWRATAFDELLSAVADDRTGPVLFFNPARGTVFAPYDGGADLFLASAGEVRDLRRQFRSWVSPHADGL